MDCMCKLYHSGQLNFSLMYRKLPIISGALTFEISSPMGCLFSGGAYYRVVKNVSGDYGGRSRTIKASSQTQRLAFIK